MAVKLTVPDPQEEPEQEKTPATDAGTSSASSSSGKSAKRETEKKPIGRPTTERARGELKTRVGNRVSRLSELLAARDPEVAEILREDGPAMAEALSWLAGKNSAAKKGLLAALAAFEPVYAFGRLGRVLAGRARARRAAWLEELERERGTYIEPETPAAAEDGGAAAP